MISSSYPTASGNTFPIPAQLRLSSSVKTSALSRRRRTTPLYWPSFAVRLIALSLLVLTSIDLLTFGYGAPAVPCRSCHGRCDDDANGTANLGNDQGQNQNGNWDQNGNWIGPHSVVVDDETGKILQNNSRTKRASFVERKTCGHNFQMEMILIPASILMIPLALCGLLLCVCCCGPEDSRGKMPEKMWGFKLSGKKGRVGNNEKSETEDGNDLEFGDGYVQRRDSKKTRFSTTVKVITEARRESVWSEASRSEYPVPDDPISYEKSAGQRTDLNANTKLNGSVPRLGDQLSSEIGDEIAAGCDKITTLSVEVTTPNDKIANGSDTIPNGGSVRKKKTRFAECVMSEEQLKLGDGK